MNEKVTAEEWKHSSLISVIDKFIAEWEHDNKVSPFKYPHKMYEDDWLEKFTEWLKE